MTKLYTLYPSATGYSVQTAEYDGTEIRIAAASVKQAYAFVYQRVWAAGPESPSGIVEVYTRGGPPEGWHQLWCGCRIHGGIGLKHGQSKTAIVKAMRGHSCSG